MAWAEIERTTYGAITIVSFRCGSCPRMATVSSTRQDTREQPSRCVCGSQPDKSKPRAHRDRGLRNASNLEAKRVESAAGTRPCGPWRRVVSRRRGATS